MHLFDSNEIVDHDTKKIFSDESVRVTFARKVFGILGVQLLATVLITIAMLSLDQVEYFFINHYQVIWVPLILSLFTLCALCSQTYRQKYPHNYCLLSVFTACESIMVGIICSCYEVQSVLIALSITAAVTISLMIYAMVKKSSVTYRNLGPLLLIYSISNLLVCFFCNSDSYIYVAITFVGCIVYCFLLVRDVRRIMDGERGNISIDDYVYAAMILYIDIIMIFLKILRLIGKKKRNSV